MSSSRILVIGSTNVDMVVKAPHLPVPGETVLGGTFRMTPGGKGANQAVAAARAGGQVSFITAVGNDAFGQQSRERFTQDGIDVSHVVSMVGSPTGVALILVDEHGENMITVAPGANGQLLPDHLVTAATAFCDAKLLIMQLEIPLESVQWGAGYAKRLGCRVLLNPAPMPEAGLPDALLKLVDILTPNEGELMALAPGSSDMATAAKAVLARGPKMVVVTQGKTGVTVFTGEEVFQAPAASVTAVDTVGAGDCFSATLGVALVEGRPLPEALQFAIAAAGLSTTVPGAQAAMPTREAIELFMRASSVES